MVRDQLFFSSVANKKKRNQNAAFSNGIHPDKRALGQKNSSLCTVHFGG
jgi:hypothetical protein